MLEINKKHSVFRIKEIWFSDCPFDTKDCDSVIFNACKNKVDAKGFHREEFTTLTIDLNQELDKIWKDMSKSSCRYAINRAKKDGIKIKINQNFDDFYSINKSFRKNKKLPLSFSWNLNLMKKYGILFVAEFGGEIISGSLFIEDENNIRWLLGASKRLEESKNKATLIGNANRLIIWEAIKYAKEKKIKNFDFGGYYAGKKEDNQKERINIFKKSFGGKLTAQYIYQKDYSNFYHFFKKCVLSLAVS